MATISGAIFDCDGTLLDSMGMWYGAVSTLVARHGFEITQQMQETIEPLTLLQGCTYLHETLGMGESPEALLDELEAWVADQYAHHVAELPGARAFVVSLAAEGIPMIIATSTTSRLVRDALRIQGMDGFFVDVVCTAEVRDGRDKDFPDVYFEALERLGTPAAETWVFEDAPFGIRSARRAGLHVASIHNDHDGRDADEVARWADIASELYESVSLEAIRAFDDGAREEPTEGLR